MTQNLQDLDKDIETYGGATAGSDIFKFQKGANKVRLLNFPVILATHFFGKGQPSIICVGIEEGCQFHGEKAPKDDKNNPKKPSLKLVTYIIDRADGKVKLAELPLSVRYSLQDLQNTEGFEFADFPMPYDIQVLSDPDNSDPKAMYRTTGIPKMIPLTTEEQEAFDKVMSRTTPEQYVEKRKAKFKDGAVPAEEKAHDSIEYPKEDIDLSSVPF